MQINVIHIYGASGSGTSTLGGAVCRELGYYYMDADDYLWLPTNPRFTQTREKGERLHLMEQDIAQHKKVVISGSLTGWGDPLIPGFDLAVRLVTDTQIRIARIKAREAERFGDRLLPGGDMYKQHQDFLAWAAAYDTGDVDMRSKALHDQWQKLLGCPQLVLDGARPVEENLERIRTERNRLEKQERIHGHI
nr:shikimate kinase [uncultured Eisenbergiella sp.]